VERDDDVGLLLLARDERGHREGDLAADVLEGLLPAEVLVERAAEGAEGLQGGIERAGREGPDLLVLEELGQRRALERVAEGRRRGRLGEEQGVLGEEGLELEFRPRGGAERQQREEERQSFEIHKTGNYRRPGEAI